MIDNLDLCVDTGETLGIIGPNGAGKTTLFNIVGGVPPPPTGRLLYTGTDITGSTVWHRCRLGIGRTYQIPRPFFKMTTFENVLAAAVRGGGLSVRQAREWAEAVLLQTKLLHRASLPAEQLSLLDLKWLGLAKTLAQKPHRLLLDEIAGGLTEAECAGLLEIVREAHTQDTTVVWIEHVIQALRRIAMRMAVLYGRGIIADGPPDAVLNDERVRTVSLGEIE